MRHAQAAHRWWHELLPLDEPSLGLAPKIIDQVYEILARLRAQRKLTLLIVEQSSTRALMTGGRMILMRGGRIVLEGPASEMVKDPRKTSHKPPS